MVRQSFHSNGYAKVSFVDSAHPSNLFLRFRLNLHLSQYPIIRSVYTVLYALL